MSFRVDRVPDKPDPIRPEISGWPLYSTYYTIFNNSNRADEFASRTDARCDIVASDFSETKVLHELESINVHKSPSIDGVHPFVQMNGQVLCQTCLSNQ